MHMEGFPVGHAEANMLVNCPNHRSSDQRSSDFDLLFIICIAARGSNNVDERLGTCALGGWKSGRGISLSQSSAVALESTHSTFS